MFSLLRGRVSAWLYFSDRVCHSSDLTSQLENHLEVLSKLCSTICRVDLWFHFTELGPCNPSLSVDMCAIGPAVDEL